MLSHSDIAIRMGIKLLCCARASISRCVSANLLSDGRPGLVQSLRAKMALLSSDAKRFDETQGFWQQLHYTNKLKGDLYPEETSTLSLSLLEHQKHGKPVKRAN